MTNHPKKATTGAAEAPEASEVPDQQSVSSSIENGQTQPKVTMLQLLPRAMGTSGSLTTSWRRLVIRGSTGC